MRTWTWHEWYKPIAIGLIAAIALKVLGFY